MGSPKTLKPTRMVKRGRQLQYAEVEKNYQLNYQQLFQPNN